jgi:mannose-1-phosphate guanylyltransferase/mannose-1-phosphate guanylyltransferase/mannose-6-phosphate isomerase
MEKNPEAILLILPADHVIENIPNFYKALEQGSEFVSRNNLITFGIIPKSPETGYGYIQKGDALDDKTLACKIKRFVEKPDLKTAKVYLESGQFCWNSGMFMFKASVIIKELKKHAPVMLEVCSNALEKGVEDLDFFRLDKESFKKSPSDSLDYAIMEKTDIGVVIPIDAGWNDLGSWEALWQAGSKDEDRNVISGDVFVSEVKNSYLHAESRLVAAVGLENHVVIETKDAVLVAPRDKVQNVKDLVNQLRKTSRPEARTHSKVFRPWGDYETIDISRRFQVKRITVKPGAKLSLQKHYHRAEHWTVVSGTAIVTNGEQEILLKEDQSTYIPLGTVHRMENPGKVPLELIEVQSGSYLGEDDIVRFDDVYGRSK